jgi:hypothetical protein
MYERTYGDNYSPDMTTKEIAAATRKTLRAATKQDGSPVDGWTASVRYRSFAGGTSIDVNLTAPEGVEVNHEWNDNSYELTDETRCVKCNVQAVVERQNARDRYWLTDAGRAAYSFANDLLSGFNFDGSEIQVDYFDVNFYGHVNVKSA